MQTESEVTESVSMVAWAEGGGHISPLQEGLGKWAGCLFTVAGVWVYVDAQVHLIVRI